MIAYDGKGRAYNVLNDQGSFIRLECTTTNARITLARAAFNACGFTWGF